MHLEDYCEVDEMHNVKDLSEKCGFIQAKYVICENSVSTPPPRVTSRVAIPSEFGESEGWNGWVKHVPQMAVIHSDLPWYKVNKSP